MVQAPMQRPTNPAMVPPMRTQAEADSQAAQAYKQMQSQQGAQQQAPQMPVQGPVPYSYGLPGTLDLFKQFASNQAAAGIPMQTQATMGPSGSVLQQPLSQNIQDLFKQFVAASGQTLPTQAPQQANFTMYEGLDPEARWRNASQGLPLGSPPPQQRMPQAGTMPFPAGDPRYVNTLPYMGPPVTGPVPDMSKQFGPQMTQPLPSTMTTTYPPQGIDNRSQGQNGQLGTQPIAGGIGQLYGQLGVNNGAQLFGQPSSAPGMAPNSAPGAAPTSGPVAAPTGPAAVNMF